MEPAACCHGWSGSACWAPAPRRSISGTARTSRRPTMAWVLTVSLPDGGGAIEDAKPGTGPGAAACVAGAAGAAPLAHRLE